jgi:hypothetical protein
MMEMLQIYSNNGKYSRLILYLDTMKCHREYGWVYSILYADIDSLRYMPRSDIDEHYCRPILRFLKKFHNAFFTDCIY